MNTNEPAWGKPTQPYKPTFNPPTGADPAERLFAKIAAWEGTLLLAPCSPMAARMVAVGYKPLYIPTAANANVFLCLRASTSDVVELQSIQADPPRRGHGSALLRRLCDLADESGVKLWLNARPFGNGRRITFGQLQAWYERFGFERVETIPEQWLVETHGMNFIKRSSLMVRTPR